MQIAIVEYAAPGRDLKGALLLPGGTVYEILVMDHLQPDETATDQADPADKEKRNMEQAETAMYCAGIHRARSGITRPLGGGISALWLTKEKELFQLHLPCWSFSCAQFESLTSAELEWIARWFLEKTQGLRRFGLHLLRKAQSPVSLQDDLCTG